MAEREAVPGAAGSGAPGNLAGPRGVGTALWLGAATMAAAAGWTLGSAALEPVTVPGPTITITQVSTRPSVPAPGEAAPLPPGWSADSSSALPAGLPEGRHEVSRLVVGEYVAIPADPPTPCQWVREGRPGVGGGSTVHEQGSTSTSARVRIRPVDAWFTSTGCQWKLLTPSS